MNPTKWHLDAAKVQHLVSAEGVLCRLIKGFQPRLQQQQMLRNVVDAYNQDAITLIEAGTGTGKSLAYLLPALLWALENKQRTLISTHTIALQQQLIEKDIPSLTKALKLDIKAVLVKGMSNYLCLRKFHEIQQILLVVAPEERAEIEKIEAWASTTKEGSKSTLPMVPSARCWEQICAESDTCSHAKCSYYQDCYFFRARRQAEEAQILVANHHLLFADLVVRAESDNYSEPAILPHYTRIVMDEAHHIEDIATEFFGGQVSRLGLLRILGKIASDQQQKSPGRLTILKEKIEKLNFGNNERDAAREFSRLSIDLPHGRQLLQTHITEAFQKIAQFAERASGVYDTSEEGTLGETKMRFLPQHHQQPAWNQQVIPAVKNLIDSLQRYVISLELIEKELQEIKSEPFKEQTAAVRQELKAFGDRLKVQGNLLESLTIEQPKPEKVRWIEVNQSKGIQHASIRDAELDVSRSLVDLLFSRFSTVVLCSATLTTDRQFQFIRQRLGILEQNLEGKKIEEHIYDSPFDYKKQALFAIPTDLPAPHEPDFLEKATEQIWQAITVSRGGTFVLFTSYTMMQQCYEMLAERLEKQRYRVFKQGDVERQALLHGYKTTPRSVLFGTDSFWEGIDVAGEALRCVIIVKLPFKVPTQPIIQARTEAISAKGGDPFIEYSLPAAIVKFKQGFGRLIRHIKDRGCIICLDTRLINKKYGVQFLNSLPECQRCFVKSAQLGKEMSEFYRKTHYLTRP